MLRLLSFLLLFAACSTPRRGTDALPRRDAESLAWLPPASRDAPLLDDAHAFAPAMRDTFAAIISAFGARHGFRMQVLTVHSDRVRPLAPMDFAQQLYDRLHAAGPDGGNTLLLLVITDLDECVTYPGAVLRRRMPERQWERADALLTKAVRIHDYQQGIVDVLALLERELESK
ncbi:MAG: TPM domain-containing protein [Chitinophagaceae bacterium]|nr:MAG: TPM domain-containing protein [Chitinophagaceae bacterium]